MSVTSLVTKTLRSIVVTAAAIGMFAGLAAVPANAASSPMVDGRFTGNAVTTSAAVARPSAPFSVLCVSGAQFYQLNVHNDAAVGMTYAYRLAAYDWTASTGWSWDGAVTDFSYGTVQSSSTMTIGGQHKLNMARGHYWQMWAQVWLWSGNQWVFGSWLLADHAGSNGVYGNPYCGT